VPANEATTRRTAVATGNAPSSGGIWDRKQQVWRVPKAAIRKLKLEHRVVPEIA
jgi:hypothetical protein